MKINVYYQPTCTWVLDGENFFCTHDLVEIVEDVTDYMTPDGPDQFEIEHYACVECGETLEGSPDEDRLESLADLYMGAED